MMYNTSFYMHGSQSYDDFCSAVEFFSHKTPMLKMGPNEAKIYEEKKLITFEPIKISVPSKEHYNQHSQTFQIKLV